MSLGGSSAPSAPNYVKVAKQQGEEERKTAEAITRSNRPTQVNPYGQITWQQDAAGNWTQTETWDPRVQAAKDAALGLQGSKLGALTSQGEFDPTDTPTFDPNSGQMMSDALYEATMGRVRPEQAREMEMMSTRLRQQGLVPGSEAYNRAMQNLMTSQGDVSAQAALQAKLAGGKEARDIYASMLLGQNQEYAQDLQNYQLPWDLAGASQGLFSGGATPQFAGFSGATGYNPADLSGAAQAQYQAKMGGYNADQAKKANTLNTAGTFGSAALMG